MFLIFTEYVLLRIVKYTDVMYHLQPAV